MHLFDRLRAERHSDAGVTLVEVLVAVAILGIAGVAIMAGLQMSVMSSDIHRKQTTSGAYVRSYAEAIEKHLNDSGNYIPCAGTNAYAATAVGFTVPSGYTATQRTAQPLDGNGNVAGGSCPGSDKGVQRLTLELASSDNRATERLTIVVRKACDAESPCN